MHVGGICLFLLFFFFPSPHKSEVMGHRPSVFPDHHDEDRTHQACRVHGVSEEVGCFFVHFYLFFLTPDGRGLSLTSMQ